MVAQTDDDFAIANASRLQRQDGNTAHEKLHSTGLQQTKCWLRVFRSGLYVKGIAVDGTRQWDTKRVGTIACIGPNVRQKALGHSRPSEAAFTLVALPSCGTLRPFHCNTTQRAATGRTSEQPVGHRLSRTALNLYTTIEDHQSKFLKTT